MQLLTGESRGAEANVPMIASRIARGAAPFLSAQQFAALAVKSGAELWCIGIFGQPGFAHVPDQSRLSIDLEKLIAPVDPLLLDAALRKEPVGSIFIDIQTRMRYRINGTLSRSDSDVIELQVREAYGNCPKYISRRSIQWDSQDSGCAAPDSGESLPLEQQELLRRADLFFMATGHPARGLDASHRGGFPGFITVTDENTIVFPDYPGNSLFNSLGNLLIDNRIGLLVPDPTGRRALRITGSASVEFQKSVQDVTTSNAPRLVKISVSRWNETSFPASVWKLTDYSPHNP